MTHYIDKDALVAEIEKKIKKYEEAFNNPSFASYEAYLIAKGKYRKLLDILQFIDTLEVKEVDLEKEFDNYTKNILSYDVQFEPFTHLYNCAKHFFELGLKAQKGE